ncbi:MAG: hypothetical protein ABJM19_08490 [Marinobacter sp.]|uniref:hypothetical protein n=1 Tax=Marinobacter sp. TaxID=50741 RepID=UPI0032996ADD
MTPTRKKNLIIIGLSGEHLQAFMNWCYALELSRDQLLIALMVNAGFVDGGLGAFMPNQTACEEWGELLIRRIAQLANA